MLKYSGTSLVNIVDKYIDTVIKELANPDFYDTTESRMHTDHIHRCSRGDVAAREYVINEIKKVLKENLSDNDISKIKEIVDREIYILKHKEYEIYDYKKVNDDEEVKISYYQLLEDAKSEEQNYTLKLLLNSEYKELDILAEEIYKKAYGTDLIDELLLLKINNIEIHDTNKIRIEMSTGQWCTISDLKFNDSDVIRKVAVRLLNQDSGGDLTEEECERESMLLDGSRITVALKPASSMNTIFIKKFDSFNVSVDDMLENGTISKEMIEDLKVLAKGRASNIVYGGINTGKTTFCKMYVGLFPKGYKIGVVDAAKDMELTSLYPDRDIITLYETDTYSLNDQFSRLLRANRHILAISEARSYEVEQMIKAMLRGNPGSFCTIHTNTAKDVVDNIAYMCLENGVPQDMRVLRSRISSAVDILIRIRHFEDTGLRRVDDISELVWQDNLEKPFLINPIYTWNYELGKAVRNKSYKLSKELEDKLRYFGCTEEQITRFK